MPDGTTHIAAIVLAGGQGVRAGGGIAKQWREIAGKRVVDWSVEAFLSHPMIDSVTLVTPDGSRPEGIVTDVAVTQGGISRAASVRAGLAALPGSATHVLVHDAARPCISGATIAAVIEALASHDGAAPALAITDAIWRGEETVSAHEPRDGLWRAQTPQGFRLDAIRQAHEQIGSDAADDVEIALAAGLGVAIVPGEETNLKITLPGDFIRAEKALGGAMDIRTGNGFDVHAFCEGDHLWLCGVRIAHDRALKGHSDADVGLHTLTDAIYGALAAGDIGTHFPPSDPQWRGAASDIFLTHACKLARQSGYEITHLDCTLICEAPKIGPHAAAMRARVAEICGLDPGRVSVKATTSERLGFTGRGEGIAAMASATLVHP